MKRRISFAVAMALLLGSASAVAQTSLTYTVDLTHRGDDRFHVTLAVEGLTEANAIYQFAATAPGTYQVMDVGRFVRDFRAFDGSGNALATEHVSTNQWKLQDPARVREIRYQVSETWDTPVKKHRIYPMAGTSIEDDHVLWNGQDVIGYPTGLQDAPLRLVLRYPADWKVGTALRRDADGAFMADDFDQLVDSPILLGRLTVARTEITEVPISIYVYSAHDKIRATQLLSAMEEMLQAAGQFLGTLPVDRYTFLYHFEGKGPSAGAWEHSYSSEYTLPEVEWSPRYGEFITDMAAHEFFHVVTPLNIHSEIIQHFNFVTPVPSEHLWLYEGVTEWASDAMRLRAGVMTPEEYLADVMNKIRSDRRYDSSYSLQKLSLTSYTDEGQKQYGNIYQRGALVAGLLDIRLLELSGGKHGLQSLILELTHRFGKNHPFPECGLFDLITQMTYPEIGDFFDRYVKAAESLPLEEYYGKLGIRLKKTLSGRPTRLEIEPDPTAEQLKLRTAWMTNIRD